VRLPARRLSVLALMALSIPSCVTWAAGGNPGSGGRVLRTRDGDFTYIGWPYFKSQGLPDRIWTAHSVCFQTRIHDISVAPSIERTLREAGLQVERVTDGKKPRKSADLTVSYLAESRDVSFHHPDGLSIRTLSALQIIASDFKTGEPLASITFRRRGPGITVDGEACATATSLLFPKH
jgi:hypothetical protein